MKQIPLTQGRFAIVDDEDYEELTKHRWHATRGGDTFYARRSVHNRLCVYMHRAILDNTMSLHTDHINGNGLDNRKCNLRTCSNTNNQRNSKLRADNTSGYKGVSWTKNKNKWIVHIKVEKKQIYLGVYTCLIAAAKAYDRAAKEHFGEYANTNFKELSK